MLPISGRLKGAPFFGLELKFHGIFNKSLLTLNKHLMINNNHLLKLNNCHE